MVHCHRLVQVLSIVIASAATGCTTDPALCPCEEAGSCTASGDAGVDATHDVDLQAVESYCEGSLGFQTGLYDQCCSEQDKGQSAWSFLRGVADALHFECSDKLKKSAAQGRIAIDGAASASCSDSFQAAFSEHACAMIWTGIEWESSTCRAAVIGLQVEGEPCRYRYECADGLFCFGYTDGVDGTCAAPPGGGSCRAEEASYAADDVMDSYLGHHPACAAGRSCQHTGVYGFCAKTSGAGGKCVLDQDCDPGLKCHLGECGSAGPAGAGQPCVSWLDCAVRLLCVVAPGATEGLCVERKADGSPCTPNVDECLGLCVPTGDGGVCRSFCGSG